MPNDNNIMYYGEVKYGGETIDDDDRRYLFKRYGKVIKSNLGEGFYIELLTDPEEQKDITLWYQSANNEQIEWLNNIRSHDNENEYKYVFLSPKEDSNIKKWDSDKYGSILGLEDTTDYENVIRIYTEVLSGSLPNGVKHNFPDLKNCLPIINTKDLDIGIFNQTYFRFDLSIGKSNFSKSRIYDLYKEIGKVLIEVDDKGTFLGPYEITEEVEGFNFSNPTKIHDDYFGDSSRMCGYIYSRVHDKRNYTKNEILNIAICIVQGFLTIFSGEPGCGKTSICDIFAESIGLNHEDHKRYVSVSVEEGWTSKRDLIGYYNPLNQTIDVNNRDMYTALETLNNESKENELNKPFLILLDEANLSPVEYYWSDFLKMGDTIFNYTLFGNNSSVQWPPTIFLGGDEEDEVDDSKEAGKKFEIPETLHFLATINNDYTTSEISPRLIDRAWVITLPEIQLSKEEVDENGHSQPIKQSDFLPNSSGYYWEITWQELKSCFDGYNAEEILKMWNDRTLYYQDENEEIDIYNHIVNTMRDNFNIIVSPRTRNAIMRYWATASTILEDEGDSNEENYRSKDRIALDFAIAQRIIPHIEGSGPEFSANLQSFEDDCSKYRLTKCRDIIRAVIEKGDQVGYYKFFS